MLGHVEQIKNRPLPPLNTHERERNLADVICRLKERFLRWRLKAQEELLEEAEPADQLSQLWEQGLGLTVQLREIIRERRQKAKLRQ